MSPQRITASMLAIRRSTCCISIFAACSSILLPVQLASAQVGDFDDDLFLLQSSLIVRSVAIPASGLDDEVLEEALPAELQSTSSTTGLDTDDFYEEGVTQPTPPPPGANSFDYRLNRFPPMQPEPTGCAVSMINPSFLLMPNGEVLAAFRLSQRNETYVDDASGASDILRGQHVPENLRPGTKIYIDWASAVYVGRAPLEHSLRKSDDQWNWTDFGDPGDFRMVGEVTECASPTNNIYTEGPEDPRLFSVQGRIYMMVVSDHIVPKMPLPLNESEISPSCAHLTNEPLLGKPGTKRRCESRPLCPEMPGQRSLYVAEVLSWSAVPWTYGPPVKLVLPSMAEQEKNWSPFVWKGPGGVEELRMIYGVYPHTVLQVDVATGRAEILTAVADSKLATLAAHSRVAPEDFHGGSGVARIERGWAGTYNLAFFHANTIDGEQCLYCYRNWPYMFSTEPPYEIIDIGLEISPTLHYETATEACYYGQIQFISSVVLDGDDLVIGYNTGDTHTRVFRMPLWEFERRFFGAAVFSAHHGRFYTNTTTTTPTTTTTTTAEQHVTGIHAEIPGLGGVTVKFQSE